MMGQVQRILIVEDDIDNAKMLVDYFESKGFEVVTVPWGEEALPVALETLPDIAVLDIRLPDIDGYEVCRRLREHRRTERIPIIFLTERSERTDRREGLRLGAVDYVTKPFYVDELHLRVRNALRRASLTTLVNPITGLPTDPLIDERLAGLLRQKDWALLSVGIQGLEGFSDRYGFVVSDDFLRALAVMMKDAAQELGDDNPFIGHTDEADFIIVSTLAKVNALCERIKVRLNRTIDYFYPVQDVEEAKQPRPRISLRIGVVTPQNGPYNSPLDIRTAALNARTLVKERD